MDQITPEHLFLVIGELTVENKILRTELEAQLRKQKESKKEVKK